LPFEFSNSLFEHPSMNRRRGRGEFAPGSRERQFDRMAPICVFAFGRRQRSTWRAATFGFRVLELDVLALETSSHRLQNICYQR